MTKRSLAIVAATLVAIIYSLNFTIVKYVTPLYIKPYGFTVLRVGVTCLLFWLVSFFVKTEKIQKADYLRVFSVAFFGIAFNILTFFKGLSYTSPIMGSVIMLTTPILVLLLSAIILREKIAKIKIVGIFIGLMGTFLLIVYGKSFGYAPHATLGNILVFLNAISYGVYLISVKKLMDTYQNPFSFIRWMYLVGFVMVLPFGWHEFQLVHWGQLSQNTLINIGFVIVFATFCTYLFNLFAMKELNPSSVSVFIYLQPLFASIYAISQGEDELSLVKIGSALLIFIGVYLVTKRTK